MQSNDKIRDNKDKCIFVTGGSCGIGAATVRALAENGYDVHFTYKNSVQEAGELLEEMHQLFPKQKFQASLLDLADRRAVEEVAEQLSKEKEIYGFIHNAAATYDALAATVKQDIGQKLMQINFWSMTCLAAQIIRPMIRKKSGRVIALGSIAAELGVKGNAIYAASKGALQSYIRTLAVEVASRGVTANVVAPGFVNTKMLAPFEDSFEKIRQQIPVARLAEPSEVASLLVYLLSPEAGYITGNTLNIDGGVSIAVNVNRS